MDGASLFPPFLPPNASQAMTPLKQWRGCSAFTLIGYHQQNLIKIFTISVFCCLVRETS